MAVGGVPRHSSPPGAAAGSPAAGGRRWRRCGPRSSLPSPRDHLQGQGGRVVSDGGVPPGRGRTGRSPPPHTRARAHQPSQPPEPPHGSSSRARDHAELQPPCQRTPLQRVPTALARSQGCSYDGSVLSLLPRNVAPLPAPTFPPPKLPWGAPTILTPTRPGAAGAAALPAPRSGSVPAHPGHSKNRRVCSPPTTGWLQGPPTSHICPCSVGGIAGRDVPTITLQLRMGSQRGGGGLGHPGVGTRLPSRPVHGRGLGEVGSEVLAPPGTPSLGCRAAHPPRQPPSRLKPPPTHSQQLNLLFQTAREPPHIAESRSRLPGARPGAPFYSHPSRRRALYPEAPHYRTGSQLVSFRIWDRRYWLGRWLRIPFPPQLGRREGYLGSNRLQVDNRVPEESHRFWETPAQGSGLGQIQRAGVPAAPQFLPPYNHTASAGGWCHSPRIPRGLASPVPTRHGSRHREVSAGRRTIPPFSGRMNPSNAVGWSLRPGTAGCQQPRSHAPNFHRLRGTAPRAEGLLSSWPWHLPCHRGGFTRAWSRAGVGGTGSSPSPGELKRPPWELLPCWGSP